MANTPLFRPVETTIRGLWFSWYTAFRDFFISYFTVQKNLARNGYYFISKDGNVFQAEMGEGAISLLANGFNGVLELT